MIKKGSQDVTQASGEVEKINIHTELKTKEQVQKWTVGDFVQQVIRGA